MAEKSTTEHLAVPETGTSVTSQETGAPPEAVAEDAHPRDQLPAWRFSAIVVMNILGAYISGLFSSILCSLKIADLLLGYDVSNLANIQPSVYDAFGQIQLLPWVAVAYSLANAASVPVFRRVAAFCELRSLGSVSLALFVVGAALCGAAPTIEALIVGRALNGIGAAGVYQVYSTAF